MDFCGLLMISTMPYYEFRVVSMNTTVPSRLACCFRMNFGEVRNRVKRYI